MEEGRVSVSVIHEGTSRMSASAKYELLVVSARQQRLLLLSDRSLSSGRFRIGKIPVHFGVSNQSLNDRVVNRPMIVLGRSCNLLGPSCGGSFLCVLKIVGALANAAMQKVGRKVRIAWGPPV